MSRKRAVPKEVGIHLAENGLLVEIRNHAVLLPSATASMDKQRDVLLQSLVNRPLVLAELLEHGASAVIELLPEQPPWHEAAAESGDARLRCSCGKPDCSRASQAAAYGDAAWEADAGLRLGLLGWTREALLAAVWQAWAAAAPLPDAAEALRLAAGPPQREPQAAVSGGAAGLAEWLAEAAEQDRLHLPGPQFHDVETRLHVVEPGGEPGPDPAPWAELLPGVPGAAKGLALVAARAMQRAEALAAPLRRDPR